MSSTHPVAETRIVTGALLELRRRADHRSECVSEVVMGSALRILGRKEGGQWLRVLAPDGYRAWARSWGTIPPNPGWPKQGVFLSSTVETIREKPGIDAMPIAPVVLGCRLELRPGARRGWRRVSTPDRRVGWIPSRAIADDRLPSAGMFWEPRQKGALRPRGSDFERASVERIVRRGMSLTGAPYRWGGLNPTGIDCSGFIRLVFGLDGIMLPRDAKDQARACQDSWIETDLDRLRAGDLVFFGRDPATIDHVALAIGGRVGNVVHASGRVRTSSLVPAQRGFEADLAARVCRVARFPWSPTA